MAKSYAKGMGQAVADRTINRPITKTLTSPETILISLRNNPKISIEEQIKLYCLHKGYILSHYELKHSDDKKLNVALTIVSKIKMEEWSDVAKRVAQGNSLLNLADYESEKKALQEHLEKATILLSGRHLQHGDETQPSRNMEVFTNCATSAMSFMQFYLLLNGSGVGRSMDDAMMVVDYRHMPIVVTTIDPKHPDVLNGEIKQCLSLKDAEDVFCDKIIHYFNVPDSREGWAKAIEKIEVMSFEQTHRQSVLLIDFSLVRPKGSPIKGMQNRPASGPSPLMNAINKIARLREAKMEPWRSTMFFDHYLAECVLVGGARRAARMATKTWRDKNIFDFISIKNHGALWSANNSVTVDQEFWTYVKNRSLNNPLATHARKVFNAITAAAYFDQTGEPGIINQDKLTQNDEGFTSTLDGLFADSNKYQLDCKTLNLTKRLALQVKTLPLHQITNPCGEITLNLLGGYCVIGDVVPYHAKNDEEALDAFKVATRALLRVNTMSSVYQKEVKRTNRIGVGITGIHEWAFKRFGFGWKDLLDEEKSLEFWTMLSQFKRVVVEESQRYSKYLGQVPPHTNTTIKPAGTTSKLFGLTEGAHLPSMREYLRWVQFRSDDPAVELYRELGYPVRELQTYSETSIVGFPTQPEICKLGMKDKLITANEATPSEQYSYLKLLEKYWIHGVDQQGLALAEETGNQVSYTLKYNPQLVSYEQFQETLIEGQSQIRCCSVMPFLDTSAYEYQPEEKMTLKEYEELTKRISESNLSQEDVSIEHIECITSACPIDFKQK